MNIKTITKQIEQLAPPVLAESYDNVGLLVGLPGQEVSGVLINLDVTEAVVDEAAQKGCNLIVAHHPIWFTPRKRLNGEDYVSRVIMKAIKQDIGIYACHTNLDNVQEGVNRKIGEKLGVQNMRMLSPKNNTVLKLIVYVPLDHQGALMEALFAAGAGQIGNYDEASFSNPGTSTFRPLQGANPHTGDIGSRSVVSEARIEVVFPYYKKGAILSAMHQVHPYETPAWQVLETQNKVSAIGSGMIGKLEAPLSREAFFAMVKEVFRCGGIRYADAPVQEVQKVAWCGGAGSFLTATARRAGAQAFITGDITYHKYFDNEAEMLLLDIGHYESEQYTSELLYDYISGSFPKLGVHLSEVNTNPVNYF